MSSVLGFLLGAAAVAALLYAAITGRAREKLRARRRFVQMFAVPLPLRRKLHGHYPGLTAAQEELVVEALRDYFRIALEAQRRLVAMPSKAVDALWHEFILSTHEYHAFCRKAFGFYLHHVPNEAMANPGNASQSLKRCWRIACGLEGIDPKRPDRLPRLFRVDAELGIADGYRYQLDCSNPHRAGNNPYCGSHIGCSSCSGGGGGDWSDVAGSGGETGGVGDSGGGDGGGGCGGGGD